MNAASASTPAQTTPTKRDDALLTDYLDPNLTLPQIARKNGLHLFELLAWLERPDIAQAILAFTEACTIRIQALAAAAGEQAVEATVRCLVSDKQETSRRAAALLIRLGKPTKRTPSVTSGGERAQNQLEAQDDSSLRPESTPTKSPIAAPAQHNPRAQPATPNQAPPIRAAA